MAPAALRHLKLFFHFEIEYSNQHKFSLSVKYFKYGIVIKRT
jgi:hypothetical protein